MADIGTCSNCRFAEHRYPQHKHYPYTPLVTLCRYNPPKIVSLNSDRAEWPVVQTKDWCGKWELQTK